MEPDYPWFHYSEFWKCIAFGGIFEFVRRKALKALYPIMNKLVKNKDDPIIRHRRALKASKYVC